MANLRSNVSRIAVPSVMNEFDMLWQPSQKQIKACHLHSFLRYAKHKDDQVFDDYASLYQWSIDDSERFWPLLWTGAGWLEKRVSPSYDQFYQ